MTTLTIARANEKGMATLEALPILFIFAIICSYAFGSFGAIHTAILGSIGARTYAYETFRHRTDLTYFRDNAYNGPENFFNLKAVGTRIHGIGAPENTALPARFVATERSIAKGFDGPEAQGRDPSTHNNAVLDMPEGKSVTVGVNPIWIMVQYGICLNAACRGQR